MTALCPDTLRAVLSAVEQYSERVAGGTTSRRAAQRGVIAACKDIAATLRTALDAAASEPPRLSAWIAACEGTELGEPAWETFDDSLIAYYPDTGAVVTLWLDDSVRATFWDTADTHECSTPAELRAALERLAQEAQR